MGKTSISWTDYSWNPIRARRKETRKIGWHCTHVTRACANCYAESINKRLGTGLEFKPGNEKKIHIFLDENMLRNPVRWHKRGGKRIFVCSMTDLFASFVEKEWLDKIFSVFEQCPDHTFQILTKRPDRMRAYINDRYARPLHNVWAGVTVCDDSDLHRFAPHLRMTNARIRWLSVEPLIGDVDLMDVHTWINWVVVGGESGKNARTMPMDTVQRMLGVCRVARIPFHMKQLSQADTPKYEDFDAFPEAFKVREFPR